MKDFVHEETPSFYYNGKRYCPFCGNELKEEVVWDEYDKLTQHYCDCEGALKHLALYKEINSLKTNMAMAIKKVSEPYEEQISKLYDQMPKWKYKAKLVIVEED